MEVEDVGAGWFEAVNSSGLKGLVPEAYIEITSFPEPSIPPPPPPATNPWATAPTFLSSSPQWPDSLGGGPQRPPPPQRAAHGGGNKTTGSPDTVDDWDDEWDDDDDDSGGGHDAKTGSSEFIVVRGGEGSVDEQGVISSVTHRRGGVGRTGGQAARGSVRNSLAKFSAFSKAGGDTYLFESLPVSVPESDRRAIIEDGLEGVAWQTLDSAFHCEIASPKKETKFHGMKSFIAYSVTPSFTGATVSRRYKHFDWLHKRLVEKYITLAIPPLPEKQIAGRFEEEFVNVRLKQLQLWVDRMCKHPVVSQSDVFHHFLTCADEKKWTAGKRKAEKDEYLGVKFFLTVKSPVTPLDTKQAEASIELFSKFVRSMDDRLRHLYAIGESNIKKHQGPFKKEYQKIGGAFINLAASFKYDTLPSAQPLTQAIEQTGQAYNDIGDLFESQPQHDMYHLLEGLLEYKGILSTFPDTLMIHKAACTKMQESAGKLGEAELQSAQAKADVITYAMLAEVQHFQQHRTRDFRTYMQTYLRGQIAFYAQITQKLEETLRLYDQV